MEIPILLYDYRTIIGYSYIILYGVIPVVETRGNTEEFGIPQPAACSSHKENRRDAEVNIRQTSYIIVLYILL